MAKPDKKMVAANKIANEWLKKAKNYRNDFEVMNPGPLKIVKGFFELEKNVSRGKLDTHIGSQEFQDIKNFLKDVQKFNVKRYKEFEKWSKNEPEKGMVFIDKKVKIGKRTDKFKEIEKDLQNTFANIEKELKGSKKAWALYFGKNIKNMNNKMKMFEKVLPR